VNCVDSPTSWRRRRRPPAWKGNLRFYRHGRGGFGLLATGPQMPGTPSRMPIDDWVGQSTANNRDPTNQGNVVAF
jgi:hypothetical protein